MPVRRVQAAREEDGRDTGGEGRREEQLDHPYNTAGARGGKEGRYVTLGRASYLLKMAIVHMQGSSNSHPSLGLLAADLEGS